MTKSCGLALLLAAGLCAQSDKVHHDGVTARGDHAMGFSHDTTTHHFRLLADGGAIEVTADNSSDKSSRDAIRAHLGHIARMFAEGNFDMPMFIHDRVPPGVDVMKQRKAEIRYRYESTPGGGRVRIRTANAQALEAVHAFLRFQITDHQTGDSLELSRNR